MALFFRILGGGVLPLLLLSCTPDFRSGLVLNDPLPFPFFQEMRGKVVVVYFGYTRCPGVCSTMLLLLTKARSILSPEERSSVQIVFADLDPEDTLSQIRSFVERFDPEVLGISLTPFLRREMEKALAIPSFVGEGGLVEHIAYAVGVDRNGMAKVLFTQEENPEEIAHDYKVLLRGSFSPLWIKEGAILLFRKFFSLFS